MHPDPLVILRQTLHAEATGLERAAEPILSLSPTEQASVPGGTASYLSATISSATTLL